MAERYDAVAVRKYQDRNGNEKTAYTNLGTAFPFRDKDGFTVRLNAFPAPEGGEYTILLFPPKPREERHNGGGRQSSYSEQSGRDRTSYDDNGQERGRNLSRDLDDEIPFAPEFR